MPVAKNADEFGGQREQQHEGERTPQAVTGRGAGRAKPATSEEPNREEQPSRPEVTAEQPQRPQSNQSESTPRGPVAFRPVAAHGLGDVAWIAVIQFLAHQLASLLEQLSQDMAQGEGGQTAFRR